MQAIINGEMYEVEPAVKVIIDKLMIENAELKKENARLEEGYQKSVGVIATDTLPTLAEMRKVSEMCRTTKCKQCIVALNVINTQIILYQAVIFISMKSQIFVRTAVQKWTKGR